MKFFSKKADQLVVLGPGQQAQNFRLPGTQSSEVQLKDLQGQPVILAFYPKDNTAVCSSQLALYNEILDMFNDHGAILLGISVDDLDTHQAFAESLNLNFPLLSDAEPRGEIARMYGVYDQKHEISQRALFVIDKDGVIQWRHISPPGINPGADGILNALQNLA